MSDLIANTAKLREMLRGTVERLKNNSPQDYVTKYVKGKAKVEQANARGFVTPLDFEENGSFAYSSPNGGSLATPHKPKFARITCNYQYILVGSEITNESLVQSQAEGSVVGLDAKATAMEKAAQRLLDMEEYYFCQGDGTQTIARVTAPTTANTTVTCAGTADGFGCYFLKVGQVIRIYDSTLTTLKHTVTITGKVSNTAVTVSANVTIIAGDLVLPEGDTINTATTTGIKGLPYIAATDTGPYFDASKTSNPNLAPIVDATAGALSRTRLEQLDTRHRIRNGQRMDTVDICSATQISQYFSLFITGAVVNYEGKSRPKADLGLDSWDYTWFGRPIRDFRFLPAAHWYKLSLTSLCRVSIGTVGKMLTPAGDYVQKIQGGNYANAQQRWDDEYVEYFSPNPALNAALTNLTITGLPMLVNDKRV